MIDLPDLPLAEYGCIYMPLIVPLMLCLFGWFWLKCSSNKNGCFKHLEIQSVEVKPGVRGSIFSREGELVTNFYPGVYTSCDTLKRGLKLSNDGPCFGHRDKYTGQYVWKSYSEVHDLAQRFGSALIEKGLRPKDTTNVGIYAFNSPEWNITAEGCSMYSMVLVPLYDTLGIDVCTFIINQTEMSLVVCGNWTKAMAIIDKANFTLSLKHIVVISNNDSNQPLSRGKIGDISNPGSVAETLSGYVVRVAKASGVEILSFEEMLQIGLRGRKELVLPRPETVNLILYTSGTTGDPKGVVLTHAAVIANISGLATVDVCNKIIPSKDDVHLSYLPAAHAFERMNQLIFQVNGARIGFGCGDVKLLLEDIASVRPTVFMTVPRVLGKLRDKVLLTLEKNNLKRILFNYGIEKKLKLVQRGVITRNTIWDKLMFHKIQNIMGGRMRVVISGSAPLSEEVMNFTRATLGCYVYEGYGQTEVCAATTVTLPFEFHTGIVGPPLPNCHIKLIDVPELNAFASDNKGEVCIKSTAQMKEYYKDPKKTSKAFDNEGFLYTGDIGCWQPNGSLKIVDRIKHIFKLSQGEYISPEKVENIYSTCPFVNQIFVDGQSDKAYPVAILVPNEKILIPWASENLALTLTLEQLCTNSLIKEKILKELQSLGREAGLKGFEQVNDIHLCPKLFTVENGLLTPTAKFKRSVMRERFKSFLENMSSQD